MPRKSSKLKAAKPKLTKTPEEEFVALLQTIGYEGVDTSKTNTHAIAQLMTTSWDNLTAAEHEENLFFPDIIYKRKGDGTWDEKHIMLKVPREKEQRKARVQARALAASEGIDEEKDKDLFRNLENLCVLSFAIRDLEPPYLQFIPDPLVLEAKYDNVSLQHIWEKLDKLNEILNPAPNQLSNGEIVALIVAIAKSRHLGPLVVYGPGAQTSFVVSMADLLLNSLGTKLSWDSLEHLMQEFSQSNALSS